MKSDYPYRPNPGRNDDLKAPAPSRFIDAENLRRVGRGNQIRQRARAGGSQESLLELSSGFVPGWSPRKIIATTGAIFR